MSDDHAIVEASTPNAKVRARSLGGSPEVKAQKVDVSAWNPTFCVAQYNVTVTTGTAQTFTATNSPSHSLISIKTSACKIRFDGADPTSTNGIEFPAGFIGEIAWAWNGSAFVPPRIIALVASATVDIDSRKYV
jgi:hypothetical protein